MKAKVTGVSAWQGTPTGGTLSIRMPRYVDSSGNATVDEYVGWLDVNHTPPRWMDGLDHTRELYIVVQGPDDPPGPRASFYEVLEYGTGKAVRTPFGRKLISSDLDGLIFDYAAPEPETLPSDFGDAPLTMRAAAAAIEQQQADHERATQDQEQVADSLTALDQAQRGVEQSRAALEAQTAQAVQQAASVSLIGQAVASEAALAGRPAGNYPVLDGTPRIVTWNGSEVTATGPELATVATSVARVPDILALTAYNGTAITVSVDDPLRGGTFTRALAAVAGAADDVMRIAHSNPTYVWQRRVSGTYLTSWARVPHVGGDNYAPFLQRLLDAVPRGGVIENNVRAAGGLAYWPVAPWARPDGRTDVILTLDRTVELRWGANQYSGYIGYDTRSPGTVDIMQVSSRISGDFPGNTTEYGLRLRDLAILPTTGQPCARHALHLMPTAANNLADLLIDGGQYVATNPDGRAIYSENTGSNGMFLMRIIGPKIRGGVRLEKLGDSVYIADGSWAGNTGVPALWISLLDPTNPTDAASQLHLKRLNINAVAQALIVHDAATITVEGCNIEGRNRHEGGAGNYGKHLVEFHNCGTKGGLAGQSARSYSGSRWIGNKVLPADGDSYDTSSGASAVLFNVCRGWRSEGGAIGTSQVLSPDGTPADNGRGITLRGSDEMIIDGVDLQLTANAIGVDIENTTKNTRWRGATVNPYGPGGWQMVRDNGVGTMGVPRELTLAAGLEAVPGGDPLRVVKDETGRVHLSGMVRPAGGAGNISPYMLLTMLSVGFRPAESIRRGVDILQGSVVDNPNQLLWRRMPLRVVGEGNGAASGRVDLSAYSNDPYDTTTPDVREMLIDCGWHAALI